MNWISLVGIFAKPLGAVINKAITAGAASVITWSIMKGMPEGVVVPLVSSVVLALSTVITGFAASQGIQIPLINADETNGVKVVVSDGPGQAVNTSPLK